MNRIYWDSMLFIYLFEKNPQFYSRVEYLFDSQVDRGHELVTSHLTLGEVLAGVYRRGGTEVAMTRESFARMAVSFLPFEAKAAEIFGRLRAANKVSSADALHLATAAANGVDLFLTADSALLKLGRIDGIRFIAGMYTDVLG